MRVTVGLSGGVDSAVSALLLARAGHDVQLVFMKNWEDDDEAAGCTTRADFIDAVAVADRLDLPIEQLNFAATYRERVFADFIAGYQAGRTPNPDVLCNREVKFAVLADWARAAGAAALATGHYARIERHDGQPRLLRGSDAAKDQSYFLHALSARQLEEVVFPVGGMEKPAVRALARAAGLPVATKRDSTGLCFIGERPFRDFLARWLPDRPGPIHDEQGRVVGSHRGAHFYTLGQREGLGVGGVRGAAEGPWYVIGRDVAANVLVVSQRRAHPCLLARAAHVATLHFIAGEPPASVFDCVAQTRHRHRPVACRVELDGAGGARIAFATPDWGVTPGQSLVLYDGAHCLGGGPVTEVESLAGMHDCTS